MNFLEICQKVSLVSGMHGAMTDVTSSKDFQRNIAQAVSDAWLSIQTRRSDWSFMHARWMDFYAYKGRSVYPLLGSAVAPAVAPFPDNFGFYQKKRSLILDYKPLTFITNDEFHTKDNTVEGRPTWFTFEPASNDLHLSLPDDTYNIIIYYYKKPQILAANTDVPTLPVGSHSVILYEAVANFATFIGNPELFSKYTEAAKFEMNNLMRYYVPSRTIEHRRFI